MSRSYSVDFKHVDMKRALDVMSEKIDDVQRRRDHYKKLSGNQNVQIPDRFGNQIFTAKEMAWLYEHELAMLNAVFADVYALFKMEVSGRPKNAEPPKASSSQALLPGEPAGSPSERPAKG